MCYEGIQVGDRCLPIGAKTRDIDYDDLVTRKVWAYSAPAAEIIPQRNCHKFSQNELANIPAELDYVIKESIPQYPEDYDGDGFYDGFMSTVSFDVAMSFLKNYEFKLTKETREWGLQKIPDTKYTYECIFEDDSHQYKLGFVFDTHYETDMKIVFVNFTANDPGRPTIENNDIILFTGGFNGTIAFANKLDHDITLDIQNPPPEGEWNEHLLPTSITIPKGKVWSHILTNFHTSDDLVYHYTVLEDSMSGKFTLKHYPRCMTEDEIRSLYSQVGITPTFPRYIPEGYWLECGVHNTNFSFHLVYYTDEMIEQFPDNVNAAFNYDFLESGGIVIYYTNDGWSHWSKDPNYDKDETAKRFESKFTNSTQINGNPGLLSKMYFWREGQSRSFNSLLIFLDDQVRYEIKGGIPQDQIIKIANSIVP